MRQKLISITGLLLLLTAANLSYGQYMNKLHDIDSSNDWGWDIFIKEDNSYFVIGSSQSVGASIGLFNVTISPDGNTIIHTNAIHEDSAAIYQGDRGAGEAKRLHTGGYIAPFDIQFPNPATGYLYSAGGIVKYRDNGDTAFIRTYTDTSNHFDIIFTCAITPDDGYLAGGVHAINTPSYAPAYIIRTDSIGDTIWTHTYQKYTTQTAHINSIISLLDGRIVVGAMSRNDVVTPAGDVYNHNSPWFLVLDAVGNIIRDTLYGSKYGGNGYLSKDTIGGLLHYGQIDSLAVPTDVNDYGNFPNYIAHLDSNFRMSWITRFPYIDGVGHRYSQSAKQLRDGNYLIYGVVGRWPHTWAWAAKIDRGNGDVMWNRYYVSDSFNDAYFTDVAEDVDGSLVFLGATFNDTLPSWHQGRDVWLVGTDANGCPIPDCDITRVHEVSVSHQPLTIYPNPTTGLITVNTRQSGELIIYNIQGQVVATHTLKTGTTDIHFPSGMSAGMYICRYTADSGDKLPVVIRLVYTP